VRASNNTTIVSARNAANTQDIVCVNTDASNNVGINPVGSNGFGVLMYAQGNASFQLQSATTDFIAFNAGSASVTGYARFPASASGVTTLVGLRNHANSADIGAMNVNTSDLLSIGDGTNGGTCRLNAPTGFASTLAVASVDVVQATGTLITTNQIINFNAASGTTTTASAGANGDVPAQVVGYVKVQVGGTDRRVPFYAV
jgi:hypothetical protein